MKKDVLVNPADSTVTDTSGDTSKPRAKDAERKYALVAAYMLLPGWAT